MDIIKLKATTRSGAGKKYTIKARMQGKIPAVYYGHNMPAENIEVDSREFATLVRARKTHHLIDLGLEGKKESIAVIKEIQKDCIEDEKIFHIDFQHVNMDEKIHVDVEVEIVGIPVGVKDQGGVLDHSVKKLVVECLPMDIPEKITVDVSALKVGESIHVRDLKIDKITFKESEEKVLAVVTHATKEAAVAATAVADGADAAAADPKAKPDAKAKAGDKGGDKAAPKKEEKKPAAKK